LAARMAKPLYIEAERLSGFKQRGADVDVVLDLMIHDLDLALSLVRGPVGQVSACGFRVLTEEIDIANARIEFADGCVASLSASRVSQAPVRKLRVVQTDVYVSANLHAGLLRSVAQAVDGGKPASAMAGPAGEYRALEDEIDAAGGGVLASGRYVLGPEGEALEGELAAYTGAPHAVGVNSGTDALHLALVAVGIGAGDEVIAPSFTFFATAEAVSYTGATPVFADIDIGTFNLDPASFRNRITSRTKAVIAVHLFGQCAALDELSRICREKDLLLVEDCAQALGADYDGRRAGSWGDFGCFSFYPTKNLGAAGDAGLITTHNPA